MSFSKSGVFALAFLLISQIGITQDIYSPLSAVALGKVRNQFQIHSVGMGGLSNALADSFRYTLQNPATSSYLRYTTFDIALTSNFNQVNTATSSGWYNDINLNYLTFGFPLNKRIGWTAAFGVLPYTASGYETAISYSNYNKIETHSFEGGLSNVFLNTALRPLKGLSVGVQGSFLFGRQEYTHSMEFPDDTDIPNLEVTNNYLNRAFTYKIGVHYRTILQKPDSLHPDKPIYRLDIGAYAESGLPGRTTLQREGISFFVFQTSISVPDTVIPYSESVTSLRMPNGFGTGIVFSKEDKWRIGLDANYKAWSSLDFAGEKDLLRDAFELRLGTSIIPSNETNTGFLKRTEYRWGLSWETIIS